MQYVPPLGSTDPNAPYIEGNPAASIRGSFPTAAGFSAMMNEICNAIAGSGLTPDPTNLSQLLAAIQRLAAEAAAAVPVYSAAAQGGLSLAGGAFSLDTPNLPANGTIGATDLVALWAEAPYAATVSQLALAIASSGGLVQRLAGPLAYYVNASTGSDSNLGTSAAPFATIQRALNSAAQYNLNGNTVTINVANGTYGRFVAPAINGSGYVNIVGNPAIPSSCQIYSPSGSAAVFLNVGIGYTLNGFEVSSAAPNLATDDIGCGVQVTGQTSVTLENIDWGVCQGAHLMSNVNAIVILTGTQTISGGLTANAIGLGAHIFASSGGTVQSLGLNGNTSLNPSLNITTAVLIPYFIAVQDGNTFVLYSSITGASDVTGSKYNSLFNGIIQTVGAGANYYPGSIAGTASSGGQYV